MVRHANNFEVWPRLRDSFPHPYTYADAEQWIAIVQRQDPQTHFAIEVHGEATGGIGLELRSQIERRSAEIGYWLGEAFWGQGITTAAAVRAVSGYGFEALNLTRIFAVPFASSVASIRILEKCRYIREGIMRRSAIKEDVVLNQVLYALTDPLNACNGFLVTILIRVAQGSSSLPFASVTTPGITSLLVALFYAGCIPPIVAERVFSSEHKPLWAALLLLWSALWLILVGAGSM